MRNYFKSLDLDPSATREELLEAIDSPLADLSGQQLADAQEILGDESKMKMYRKVFTQYEAMRAAIGCIESSPGLDTNHWQARLADFDVSPEDYLK